VFVVPASARLRVRKPPSGVLMVSVVVELIAGLIFGLACVGFGVFQLVAPRRMARLNVRYNRWWYALIPWLYALPTMKKHIDEDAETRASKRFFGPVFIAMGVVFTVRAVMAAISAT
jgi:hypothetical protein